MREGPDEQRVRDLEYQLSEQFDQIWFEVDVISRLDCIGPRLALLG
jgi:hypothetical protein